VFYGRDGQEWDALVVDVVVHPISMLEAALAPFVRLRDMAVDKIQGLVGGKAQALDAQLTAKASTLPAELSAAPPTASPAAATAPVSAVPASSKPAAAAPAAPGGGVQNLLVGGSVAVAALGSATAFIVQTVSEVDPWEAVQAVGVLAGLLLAFSALAAWFRLRARDLAALMEATGMAVNARIRLSRYLAGLFTLRPGLPPGAKRRVDEPTGRLEKAMAVLVVTAAILGLLAWRYPSIFGL
jgi:hypothetical protein